METARNLSMTMHIVDLHLDIREEKRKAIASIWSFVHAALYKNEVYSEKEVLNFQFLIEEHYDSTLSPQKNFLRMAIRVMLAKRYMEKKKSYQLPRPALWLNKNYENGLSKTISWYEKLLEKRKLVGAYAQPLYTLACGLYKYSLAPNTPLFQLYREKLLHLKAYNCLEVFYTAVLFQNHSTK